jgi:hypothetical protein
MTRGAKGARWGLARDAHLVWHQPLGETFLVYKGKAIKRQSTSSPSAQSAPKTFHFHYPYVAVSMCSILCAVSACSIRVHIIPDRVDIRSYSLEDLVSKGQYEESTKYCTILPSWWVHMSFYHRYWFFHTVLYCSEGLYSICVQYLCAVSVCSIPFHHAWYIHYIHL